MYYSSAQKWFDAYDSMFISMYDETYILSKISLFFHPVNCNYQNLTSQAIVLGQKIAPRFHRLRILLNQCREMSFPLNKKDD